MKNILSAIRKHKIRSILALVVIAIGVFYFINTQKPPAVEKTKVVVGTVESVIEASGKVQAKQAVTLGFSVPGLVTWVGVKKGDTVVPYQALASQDQREVEKNIKLKLLDYMNTRWSFDQLQDDNNVHGNKLNDVGGLTDAEKRILEQSQFGLDQSVLDVEIAALAREQYLLLSPIAGTVTDDGFMVAGERLTTTSLATKEIKVVDLNTLYFQANIDESDYAKIKAGQEASIKLDSFPDRTVKGTVDFIGREGVKKTGGSVQIPVDIKFTSAPDNLVPELNGDIEIIMARKTGVLTVDKRFVRFANGRYSVQVLEGKTHKTIPVSVGLIGTSSYELVSGVRAGQEIVIPAK